MLTLILISLATAALLALFSGVSQFIVLFISNAIAVNAVFALTFSTATSFLADISGIRERILYILACSFLSKTLLIIAEKITNFHATIVRNTHS